VNHEGDLLGWFGERRNLAMGVQAVSIEAVTKFHRVSDDLGTSGQPTRDQFADIAAAGFEAVINLALPSSDNAIADEGAVVTALGMSYFHVPVVFQQPKLEELRMFLALMKGLEGRRKWVHCVVNMRASAFCYHYLRHVRGLDEADSRSPVLRDWEPQMQDVWREFLLIRATDLR
jgi:protein tyrosine phosphatase (PTP) superfamily phosphohydrolase (DUF442 family)